MAQDNFDPWHLSARVTILEMLLRGLLASMVARSPDLNAAVDRISSEMQTTLELVEIPGVDEAAREAMRHSFRAVIDSHVRAIRGRAMDIKARD
jgi:hypothetical protein